MITGNNKLLNENILKNWLQPSTTPHWNMHQFCHAEIEREKNCQPNLAKHSTNEAKPDSSTPTNLHKHIPHTQN